GPDDPQLYPGVEGADSIQHRSVSREHPAGLHGVVDLDRRDDALLDEGRLGAVRAWLDPEARPTPKALQDFLERLHPLACEARIHPAAGVEALEIPYGMSDHASAAVRHPCEERRPEDHRLSIEGEPRLYPDGVGPLRHGRLERGNGVIGRPGRGAA